jgi:alpha-tubulin suppressor-like RCC1 family protein/regulator of replication initiation timing
MANNSSETSSKSSDTPRHKFGQICTFGFGQEGRLGHGDARDQSKPTLIVFDTKIKFTQVAGGAFHSLALTKEGKIWSWGRGLFGQLGTGDTETRYRPILVDTVPPDIIFAKIAAGSDHSLAITTTGRLYTWGRATKGTLGHGDSNNQLKPKLVEFFKETTKVTSADGGSCFSVVTTEDGQLWELGLVGKGQVSYFANVEPSPLPKLAKSPPNVKFVSVSAGDYHAVAISDDGKLYSWGSGMYGVLGHCDTSDQLVPRLIFFTEKLVFVKVAASSTHTLALTNEGVVYSWGRNQFGQLGFGDTKDQTFPKKVEPSVNAKFKDVAAGYFHSVALSDDGVIWSWGHGGNGRLGHGNTNDLRSPKAIETCEYRFTKIASGDHHTLAITGPQRRPSHRVVKRRTTEKTSKSLEGSVSVDTPSKVSKHAHSNLELSETRDKKTRSPRVHPPRSRSELHKSDKDTPEAKSRKEGEKKVEFEESTVTSPRSPRGNKVKGRKRSLTTDSDSSQYINEIQRLESERQQLKAQIQRLKEVNVTFTEENKKLKQENENLAKEIQKIRAEQTQQETEITKLKALVTTLTEEKKKLEDEVKAKPVSSGHVQQRSQSGPAVVAPPPPSVLKRPAKSPLKTSLPNLPPPKIANYTVLIDYHQVKKKVSLQGVTTVEDFTHRVLSHFKLSLSSALTLEYWDPDFNEWVLLDSLQNLPNKVKVRIIAKNVEPTPPIPSNNVTNNTTSDNVATNASKERNVS